MPTFYDSTGKSHVLTQEIGRGGEGAVYFCEGNNEFVAKIYHEPVMEEKAAKLIWMAENNHEILQKVAAWVVEVLYDKPDGKIVGFLMPNINAKEIHELYSLKSRRVHFPDANWHFLIHTATNVARAFYSLQKYDHVMGDVNHGNCVVLADRTVKLIDCDSYAIKADEKRYACEVGVATHLAPELQKANLSEVERLPRHDNFGLAVIIFQLLFLGRHPFSGNYLGEKDKTLEDCIREYRFAFGKNSGVKNVKQPPGTLSLREVSPRVAELFERAFDEKTTRPSPQEWIEALAQLSENLEQCIFHPGHHFFNNLSSCPWCKLEGKTGLILFPFTIKGENGDGEKPFNIYTVENLIANIGKNSNLPATLPKPVFSRSSQPTPKFAEINEQERNKQIMIVGGYFLLVIILMVFLGVGVMCVLNFIMIFLFIYILDATGKPIRNKLNQNLAKIQNELEFIESDWFGLIASENKSEEALQIRNNVEDYKKLQQRSVKDLKRLHTDIRRRQFNEHLSSTNLRDADIWGMSDEKLKFLTKKGIKTAAEATEKRLLYYYNIDNETTEKLLEWRREVEGKFQYNSTPEITYAEKEKIKQKTSEERGKIEKEINKLLKTLGSGSNYLQQKQAELTEKSKELLEAKSQVEANINSLGGTTTAVAALVLVSFLTPIFGVIIGSNLSNNSASDYSTSPPPPLPDSASTDNLGYIIVPNENITDEEILELPETDRENITLKLMSEADTAIENKLYEVAEKKLIFADRFGTNDFQIVKQLGFVLYEQEKFSESLEYFKEAKKLVENGQSDDLDYRKNYIGMNYLQ
ncbi:MAG: helix-hairpin-helix domain-containing protein [Aridibacter sp.]